ncbi:outer membrane protein [Legionella sp. W05-934-2]|jgi:hypothetical protein|uniref:outer membrane protein n=1 Tax=Legionella sp. W05-934-2 TaxID=1198649 RepID=UPI0034637D33
MEHKKLDRKSNKLASKALSGCLLALSVTAAYSGSMGPESITSPGQIYVGVFGGGGGLTRTDISQFGSAFIPEANGGPLAVNSFGRSESSSTGMVGGHIGVTWSTILGEHLPVTPAFELEGYYMGGITIEGHDIDNNTLRIPEHDFLVKYPLKTGVFLVNAVLNSQKPVFGKFRPYAGIGIGSAVLSISGATSIQTRPAEPGINHYNADTDDTAFAFAAQPKVGVRFDLNPHASVFAEYRFLYLSDTHYQFGSTVYAPTTHVATAPWLVKIKSQHYNMGSVGIEFDV